MKQEWIEKTYDVVDEIKATSGYQRLLELREIIDQDEAVQQLITTFQKQQQKHEEVKQYGSYHPDLKQVRQAFQEAKQALYTNELVQEYKQLEQSLQTRLNQLSAAIAQAVSDKIKYPNEFGLIPKH